MKRLLSICSPFAIMLVAILFALTINPRSAFASEPQPVRLEMRSSMTPSTIEQFGYFTITSVLTNTQDDYYIAAWSAYITYGTHGSNFDYTPENSVKPCQVQNSAWHLYNSFMTDHSVVVNTVVISPNNHIVISCKFMALEYGTLNFTTEAQDFGIYASVYNQVAVTITTAPIIIDVPTLITPTNTITITGRNFLIDGVNPYLQWLSLSSVDNPKIITIEDPTDPSDHLTWEKNQITWKVKNLRPGNYKLAIHRDDENSQEILVTIAQPFGLGIDAPTSAPYGHWTLSPRFVVTNNLNAMVPVTIETWVGGYNWGGKVENYLYPEGNTGSGWTIASMSGNTNGITLTWTGWIEPLATVVFGFDTDTESTVDTSPKKFLELKIGSQVISQTLELTQGPGLGGSMSLQKVEGQSRHFYWLTLTTTAQFMGQFKMQESISSNCNLLGLPSGYVGNFARTLEVRTYFIEFVSGGPVCHLRANVAHFEAGVDYIPVIEINGTFNAPWKKVFIPHVKR